MKNQIFYVRDTLLLLGMIGVLFSESVLTSILGLFTYLLGFWIAYKQDYKETKK